MNNAEKFKQMFGFYATEMWAKSEQEFLDWINAEYVQENRWTPCSESLPEENEMVLISAKYIGHLSNNAPYVEEGFFTHDGWYSAYGDNYSELLAKVVAWMPRPEPYKGEES